MVPTVLLMQRTLAACLFASIVVVYATHFNYDAAGSPRFVDLTRALVEYRTTRIEAFQGHPWYGDFVDHEGEQHINTNPGLSYLGYPFYAAFRPVMARLEAGPIQSDEGLRFIVVHLLLFVFLTALPSATGAVLLGHLASTYTGSQIRGVLATLLYAFGTIAFFFSTRVNQNVVIAALCVFMFALVFSPGSVGLESKPWRAVALGTAAGWAVFIDLSAIPFLLVIAFPAWRHLSRIEVYTALAAAALPISALLAYQGWAFGNPFLPAQAYTIPGNIAHESGLWGIGGDGAHVMLGYLVEYLVGMKAGLVVYMPFTLVALFYLVRHRRRALTAGQYTMIAFVVLVYLAFAASQRSSVIHSFFGPRYMLPAIPFLVLVFSVHIRRSPMFVLATATASFAVFVNVAGASLGLDTKNVFFTLALFLTRGPDLPIIQGLRSGDISLGAMSPEFVTSSGLYFLMLLSLATIWMIYWVAAPSSVRPKRPTTSRSSSSTTAA